MSGTAVTIFYPPAGSKAASVCKIDFLAFTGLEESFCNFLATQFEYESALVIILMFSLTFASVTS